MNTTITEYKTMCCSKCGGAGRLACFQHLKGGECFRCGGTGVDPIMTPVAREMTDEEVLAALESAGFPVVFEECVIEGDDYLDALFGDHVADAQARRAQAMKGARQFLAAL